MISEGGGQVHLAATLSLYAFRTAPGAARGTWMSPGTLRMAGVNASYVRPDLW